MSIRATFTGVVLLISSLCPSHLSAQSSSNEKSASGLSTQIVDYSDLDLRALEGQEQLYRRVTSAVIHLCEANQVITVPLYELIGQKRCKRAATLEAGLQIAAAISRARNSNGLATMSGPTVVRLTVK